ncbi:two-component system sensor histidine kinase ChiS [Paenibacillus rhizosphaerae]|uniref:Oxygen sensor histidine kinase NreB n=2 Tax=Paenibacillus rhizosphaerae TaxID=297318 RepID=A0A839TN74_9BACL|nr:two-component system sensor histidine kinase ChiS [Paenibacillus rhizosphaerae]
MMVFTAAWNPAVTFASSSLSVKNGEVQLSGWDFRSDGSIELNGTWEFYWRQLLWPADLQSTTSPEVSGYVEVPGYWTNHRLDGTRLPPDGYATYRMVVRGLHPSDNVAIKLRNVYSSYALWVNDKLEASSGQPGTTPENTSPKYGATIVVPVEPSPEGSLTLLIQVSNFTYPKGGINNSLELGDARQLQKERSGELVQDSLVIGALLVMGVYHLFLYGFRRKDVTPLYFGLFCMCIAFRTMLVGSRYILEILPGFSWEWFAKASYLTVYVGEFFLISFIYYLFPQYLSRSVRRVTQMFTLILTLLVLITDIRIYDYSLLPFEVYSIGLVLYAIYASYRIARQRQEGSLLLILGFSLIFVTALNDTLNRKGILDTPALLQFGVLSFVFMQSLLISKRFSRAFYQVESLSERLLTLDKLKDEFLAKTSHELRTPLHGIIGLADSLIDGSSGKLPLPVIELLRLMKISGQRLAHLVNDILDFSKLKHQEITLVKVTVDLRLAVDLTLQVLKPLAVNKGLQMENKLPDDLYVTADENRLQQILHNLIGNAIAYTESGAVTITGRKSHGQAKIQIKDSGIGIAESDLSRIFESFEQIQPMNRPQQGGTGIGLSITKKLIELHEGEIEVASKLGEGSTFSFTLPLAMQQMPPMQPVAGLPPQDTVSSRDRHTDWSLIRTTGDSAEVQAHLPSVLIVDDDPINIQVLLQFLGGKYALKSTGSGQEAVEWIRNGYKPDIALLDVMMPFVSGLQVGQEIRRQYNSGELPVIFLSAKSQMTDLVAGFEHGGNDYLVKPVDKQELLARLELHLQLVRWNQTLEREVEARTIELEHSLEERARAMSEVSVLAERNRIAGEIHDHVGHILTASIVQLQAGLKMLSMRTPESVDKLNLASELVRKGLHEMRKSVHMLGEEAAATSSFHDSLLQIIEDSEKYAEVKLEHIIEITDGRLEPEAEKLIRHALQEGITNGIRHGRCTHFRFGLVEEGGSVRFTLENNGLPYAADRLGFGLTMMRQTIRRRGGTFRIGTNEGAGCLLVLTLPSRREDQ